MFVFSVLVAFAFVFWFAHVETLAFTTSTSTLMFASAIKFEIACAFAMAHGAVWLCGWVGGRAMCDSSDFGGVWADASGRIWANAFG